eukprot:1532883-Prorocentrum_lima.AAC.1
MEPPPHPTAWARVLDGTAGECLPAGPLFPATEYPSALSPLTVASCGYQAVALLARHSQLLGFCPNT